MGQSPREPTEGSRNGGPALGDLLAQSLPALHAWLRLHCGPTLLARESVSDVAHSVCRELLETGARFEYRGEPAFRAFLFQTAANMIKERQRSWLTQKRDVRREAAPDLATGTDAAVQPSFVTPSQVAIRDEDMRRLEQAFAQLSEEHRQVVVEAKLIGRSHKEIAALMGRSEAATRVLLHRALLRLATLLDQE